MKKNFKKRTGYQRTVGQLQKVWRCKVRIPEGEERKELKAHFHKRKTTYAYCHS